MSETVHDPLVGYYRDEVGRWVIADAGDHFPALVDDRTATLLDALAIARQQLADVAYLEEWRAADLRRYVYSVAGGDAVRWIAVDPLTPTDVIAESVPALGALLRAIREEGGR